MQKKNVKGKITGMPFQSDFAACRDQRELFWKYMLIVVQSGEKQDLKSEHMQWMRENKTRKVAGSDTVILQTEAKGFFFFNYNC